MKNKLMMVGAFVLGAVISGFVVKYRYDQNLLWGLYIHSASEINGKIVALSELRAGHKGRAMNLLDQSLEAEVETLSACRTDLCRNNAYPEFTLALRRAEAYEKKYNIH